MQLVSLVAKEVSSLMKLLLMLSVVVVRKKFGLQEQVDICAKALMLNGETDDEIQIFTTIVFHSECACDGWWVYMWRLSQRNHL